ncbi:MAG TPA: methyltransferase domain-containing protein [Candidatus Acidoferrales bacterium]|nr:methyltransferase domain-containing protein [Candidatus Acidoferrales bacterium]
MSFRVFAAEALADFYTTAAIAPSSSHLASAMLAPLDFTRARVVLELGAGTGAITQSLLNALPSSSTLIVFEINLRFWRHLKRSFRDPRLVLINANVANMDAELKQRGYERVDAVVSSLGLGFMSEDQRQTIFQRLMPFVHEDTILTQYQYIHGLQFANGRLRRLSLRPTLSRYFRSVQSKIVWRNLPPACVFTCKMAVASQH